MDTLSRLNELHQRFDGAIPAAMLAIVQHGSREAVELLQAEANLDFCRRMVIGQVDIIRNRRLDGSFYPALITDLRYYRARYLVHFRHARELRRVVKGEAAKARA